MNIALMMVLMAAAGQGAWADLIDLAVQILIPTLMLLGSWVALKLAKKFGVEGAVAAEHLGSAIVRKGIGYAERWGKKYLAERMEKPAGWQKLSKAIEYIAALEGNLKLSDKLRDVISRRIHSELGQGDLFALVATGEGPTTPEEGKETT